MMTFHGIFKDANKFSKVNSFFLRVLVEFGSLVWCRTSNSVRSFLRKSLSRMARHVCVPLYLGRRIFMTRFAVTAEFQV